MRGGKPKTERNNQIRALLEQGMGTQEVAERLGMKRYRVYQIAVRDGMLIEGRPAGRHHDWLRQREQQIAGFARSAEAKAITDAKRKYWEESA